MRYVSSRMHRGQLAIGPEGEVVMPPEMPPEELPLTGAEVVEELIKLFDGELVAAPPPE